MVKVLVTGANGQLGQALQKAASQFAGLEIVFCNSATLDITQQSSIESAYALHQPKYCINAAAYTAVDKAESDSGRAYEVNVTGVGNLAAVSKESDTTLIHVSTDFVFDGNKKTPYSENDETHPTGVYGRTKREGEMLLQEIWKNYYIVRTSWVYSEFGNNFMKTMIRLGSERDTLSVVNDQIGTPTNANDLAEALLLMIEKDAAKEVQNAYGIYNFSNEGSCSWFDFAAQIFEDNGISVDLSAIPSSAYPTPAKRPAYSVLDKSKIKSVFGITISDWRKSLQKHTV